jgi:DNA-binding transcriptional MerR regulator
MTEEKLYYRIGEVAQKVGVDAHVLRYWESEFKMKPHRSSSGQRLYRRHELSYFMKIKRLVYDEGYTISGARRVMEGSTKSDKGIEPQRIKDALKRLEALQLRLQGLKTEILHGGEQ